MASLAERASGVRWLLLDVDGVLTDGSITYTDQGAEVKSFHVRDGSALKLWQQAGHRVAIISGRRSSVVERRAQELGIEPELIFQGQPRKLEALATLLRQTGADPARLAAIGDDLPDLPVLRSCGVGIAVRDAVPELRAAADYVTLTAGGRGAVREAIEWLLRLQGRWEPLIESLRAAVPQPREGS